MAATAAAVAVATAAAVAVATAAAVAVATAAALVEAVATAAVLAVAAATAAVATAPPRRRTPRPLPLRLPTRHPLTTRLRPTVGAEKAIVTATATATPTGTGTGTRTVALWRPRRLPSAACCALTPATTAAFTFRVRAAASAAQSGGVVGLGLGPASGGCAVGYCALDVRALACRGEGARVRVCFPCRARVYACVRVSVCVCGGGGALQACQPL